MKLVLNRKYDLLPNVPFVRTFNPRKVSVWQNLVNMNINQKTDIVLNMICIPCVRAGAAGSRTRRSLGHYLLHPLILRLLVLCAPAVLRTRHVFLHCAAVSYLLSGYSRLSNNSTGRKRHFSKNKWTHSTVHYYGIRPLGRIFLINKLTVCVY